MKSALTIMFGVAAVAMVAAPLTSYAGGTITGKVTYAGKPEQKEFLFSKFPNPKFCPKNPNKSLMDGDKRFLKQIEVGKDGGLKGAVVAVTDVEDKAFVDGYAGTEVTAAFCEFCRSAASSSTPVRSRWRTRMLTRMILSLFRVCSIIPIASP